MMDGVTRGIDKSLSQWEVVMCHLVLSLAGAYKRNGRAGLLVRNTEMCLSPGRYRLHPGSQREQWRDCKHWERSTIAQYHNLSVLFA